MKESQRSHATGDAGGEKERKGMQETIEQVQATLKVIVTYPAAFGLSEGQSADGKTFVYTLYHGKTPLENLSETLGQIAGDKHTLELKLSQQVTQG